MLILAPLHTAVLAAYTLLLIGFASITALKSAVAVELIMVHSPTCEWCDTWEDEVGVIYTRTEQGTRVPLRRIDVDDMPTSAISIGRPVTFTPTFLLLEGKQEVGRITGYPGESHFWYFLDELLKKTRHHRCLYPATKTQNFNNETGPRLC